MKKKFLSILWVFVTALTAMVVFSSCMSTIPYTGQLTEKIYRYQDQQLYAETAARYHDFLNEARNYDCLVTGTDEAQMVQRVGDRIRDAAERWAAVKGKPEYLQDFQWEYALIRLDEANAWCAPGGKIAVYTGILPLARNEDGLAAILGHEVAHALLKHTQQEMNAMSQDWASIYGLDTQVHQELPYSRAKETEADKVGLSLMVIAGYNGAEAAAVWDRMAALGGNPPEFLSTHPSSARRADDLRKELSAAQRIATQVNKGVAPARQFVEKTLSVGGSFFMPDVWGPLLGTVVGLVSGSKEALESASESFDPGVNIFFDAKYIELNVSILPKNTVRYLFEGSVKFPFPLNPKTTWFPIFGANYGDYGLGVGPTWGINYGFGLDFAITQRLFFRSSIALRQWIIPGEDGIVTFPIRLGVGYAFY